MASLGRLLIVAGLGIALLGLFLTRTGRLPLRLGRLPGDIVVQGKHSTFYFPLMTCLVLSLLLSLVLWILRR